MCRAHAELVHKQVEADRCRRANAASARSAEATMRMQTKVDAAIAAGEMRPVPPKVPREFVYYVQVGGHIKIGWTSQLDKRMHSYPPNSTLLAVHPGSRADERQLHKRFAVHRSHGQEWYPLVPVILDHIKRVIADHGEPPAMTFGAKPVEVPRPHQTKNRLEAKYGPMGVM